jgi:hypothetical protein
MLYNKGCQLQCHISLQTREIDVFLQLQFCHKEIDRIHRKDLQLLLFLCVSKGAIKITQKKDWN